MRSPGDSGAGDPDWRVRHHRRAGAGVAGEDPHGRRHDLRRHHGVVPDGGRRVRHRAQRAGARPAARRGDSPRARGRRSGDCDGRVADEAQGRQRDGLDDAEAVQPDPRAESVPRRGVQHGAGRRGGGGVRSERAGRDLRPRHRRSRLEAALRRAHGAASRTGRLQARREVPRGRRGGSAAERLPQGEVPEGRAGAGTGADCGVRGRHHEGDDVSSTPRPEPTASSRA